jgi:ribosomal protein S18 acetylase RimI-like enzyme
MIFVHIKGENIEAARRDIEEIRELAQAKYGRNIQVWANCYCVLDDTEVLLKAGDTLLGYFVVMQGVEEAHLLNIALAPEYQRQGWAPLMLEAVEIWARARSAVWLWLEVRSGNTRAQAVYRTRGFEPVGRRNGYYAAGRCQREDAVVMRLAL